MRRRELLAGAGGGLIGLAVAGVPGVLGVPGLAGVAAAAPASANPDIPLLEQLVQLEYSAAIVYELLAAAPVDAATRALMTTLGREDRDHAAVLLNAAEYIGGPPQQPPPVDAVRRAVPAIARARRRRDVLAIALEAERSQLRAYYAAQGRLDDVKLVQQTAMVMCSDAQHATLVREGLGEDPIPAAFELGVS